MVRNNSIELAERARRSLDEVMSLDHYLRSTHFEKFSKEKSKVVNGRHSSLDLEFAASALSKTKRRAIVGNLFGKSADSGELLQCYNRMIRILPEEFDLKRLKKCQDIVARRLSHPDAVYTKQAQINPSLQKKLIELEHLV